LLKPISLLLHLAPRVVVQDTTVQTEVVARMQEKKLTGLKFRSIQLCPIGTVRIFHRMQAALRDHAGMMGRHPSSHLAFLAQVHVYGHTYVGIGAVQNDLGFGGEIIAIAAESDQEEGTDKNYAEFSQTQYIMQRLEFGKK
jgi:hypothetical protein